jgi:3-methyladenine DNA glycosylase AlkD
MSSELVERIVEQLGRTRFSNAAALHRARREASKQLRNEAGRVVWAIANRLMAKAGTANRFFACGLVRNHPGAFELVTAPKLERFGAGMDSWEEVDIFATILAGHAYREGRVSEQVIKRWARSKDTWWRRAALVSTVALNVRSHGGTGDAKRTLEICKLLLRDREDMVVKAMPWALRALAVRDPRSVQAFIATHEGVLAARVLREVRSKLSTGLKNPRPAKRGAARDRAG